MCLCFVWFVSASLCCVSIALHNLCVDVQTKCNLDRPQGPDYRLYKSEPELTTVAEVDESNGEDRSEHASDRDPSGARGTMKARLAH